MSSPSTTSAGNQLIENLPRVQRERILEQCTTVNLVFGEILCSAGLPLEHVYFPLTGFISRVTPLEGHEPLEVGMIGSEGMLGATLALGIEAAPI